MSKALVTVAIQYEQDIVVARQRARQIATLLGFESQDQTRIATAVSEIARNAYSYAGGGKVEFALEGELAPQVLAIRVSDQGPGIADVEQVLRGDYRSTTGMGMGLIGSHRLMDRVEIHSGPGQGTDITLRKILSPRAPVHSSDGVARIVEELARKPPLDANEELQEQNRELLRALSELRERQEELLKLNRELEDTNRGVVALYAELDEKADYLRRADAMKSKFLSNMSHEFRTPLNSIRALSRLLLEHTDGELNAEQDKQVTFIAKAAEALTELVNDLLDLAKIEAGKTEVHAAEFSIADLFSALRGMLRPLLSGQDVKLVFEEPDPTLVMYNDEGKVAQILRNFISNAIKYTERGTVRVSAACSEDGRSITLSVSDTGIGIEPEDQERIFEDFVQIANPLQSRIKGTGLGLPLCRQLARLMNGEVSVRSEPGAGSTFSTTLPVHALRERDVLVIDDDPAARYLLQRMLADGRTRVIEAVDGASGLEAARAARPAMIFLDLNLPDSTGEEILDALARDSNLSQVPVAIVTSRELSAQERERLGTRAQAVLQKNELNARTAREILSRSGL